MIVRTRDAPLGSPTDAGIKPAPIEATTRRRRPIRRCVSGCSGHTLAAFTARLPQVEFVLVPASGSDR